MLNNYKQKYRPLNKLKSFPEEVTDKSLGSYSRSSLETNKQDDLS